MIWIGAAFAMLAFVVPGSEGIIQALTVVASAVMLAAGGYFLYSGSVVRVSLSRRKGELRLLKRSLRKSTHESFPFAEIRNLLVYTYADQDSREHALTMRLNDGRLIKLLRFHIARQQTREDLAAKARAYLEAAGFPMTPSDSDVS